MARPVPLLTAEDRALAAPLAQAFGYASAEQAFAEGAVRRPGRVLAWDAAAWPAACLLAALTGRQPPCSTGSTAGDLSPATGARSSPLFIPDDADIIVGLAASIDDALVARLLGLARPSVVGLVVGRTAAELRARAIAAAIAAQRPPASLPRRIALQPDWQMDHANAGLFQIFGASAPAGALRAALVAGDTLITLAGHGDGIDGELAGGLVLCPQDADFATLDAARKPLCRITGRCYRLKVSPQEPAFRNATVHPTEIVSRALVWNSCVGWPAREGFIDRDYGAGLRLAASPGIGALVTTERVVIAPRDITEPLISEILRGMTLGAAVARHNASPRARQHSHRLLLFGDPETRIAPSLPQPTPSMAFSGVQSATPVASPTLSPSDRALRSDLGVLLAGSPAEAPTAAWTRLRERVKTETLEGFWARTAHHIAPAIAAKACPYCGSATSNHALSTDYPVPLQRIVRICPRCEVISDTAAGDRLSARIDRGTARLVGRLPPGAWQAALIVRQRWPHRSAVHVWPSEKGRLCRRMAWTLSATGVPLMLCLLVHGPNTLSAFSRALPGRDDPETVDDVADRYQELHLNRFTQPF